MLSNTNICHKNLLVNPHGYHKKFHSLDGFDYQVK